MGKTLNRDGSVRSVDVSSLFRRLAIALDVPEGMCGGPADWIDLPFPDQSLDAEKFRDQYLLKEVVRKYPGFDLGIDTGKVAVASFLEDEAINAETNDRLNRNPASENEVRARQLMFAAGRKAVAVLGRFPWDRFLKALRFGPGSTTRLARKDASIYGKLTGTPTVSRRALPLAREIMSVLPGWAYRNNLTDTIKEADLALRLCEYDLLRSVTKNAKTDRTIGIPNDMQILMQLAVGYCFRLRLWKAGINLNDQSINQRRAREGSLTGKRATVDLRSASNSVTRVLVWCMYGDHPHRGNFDPTWYAVMDTLRADYALIDDTAELHEYELFSAMGNGFTFELESLTFWALANAVCEYLDIPPDVTVYGDDLVVPTESVELLTEVLGYCGFRLNTDKTFSDDKPSFRESCGKHYLRGVDVSPFYVDTELDTVSSIVVLANNITRWSARGLYRDGRLLPVWNWVVSHLPDWVLECTIPYGESDDGLIMDFDQACPSAAYSEGVKRGMPKTFLGYRCKTFEEGTRMIKVSGRAGYVTWLYNQSYVRFTPPAEAVADAKQRLWVPHKGKYPTELRLGQGSDLFEAFDLVTPRELVRRPNGQKKSTREVRRTVTNWPYLGPWVTDDDAIGLSHIDVKLCASLARLT